MLTPANGRTKHISLCPHSLSRRRVLMQHVRRKRAMSSFSRSAVCHRLPASKLLSHTMNYRHRVPKSFSAALLLALALASLPALCATPQHTTALQPDAAPPHRTRLILKDGSYQIVMSYKVVGNVVRYVSAERAGEEEEIPLSLVDLDATQRWERQHAKPDPNNPNDTHTPVIDPELLKEEADRA